MTFLLVALALVAALVGVLFAPWPGKGERQAIGTTRLRELEAARQELLARLDALDEELRQGRLDASEHATEQRDIEAHLARVLRDQDAVASGADANTRKRSRPAVVFLAGLTLFVLAVAGYVGSQADYWRERAAVSQNATSGPGQAKPAFKVPPMALAMVARLEGKLKENPGDGDGWRRLGRAYTVMGRFAEAADAYAKAGELLVEPADGDADLIRAWANAAARGGALRRTDANLPAGIERQLDLLTKAAEAAQDAKAWARLATVLQSIGQTEKAESLWGKALAAAPDDPQVLAGYAAARYIAANGEPTPELTGLYQRLHRLQPGNPTALWYLGYLAYRQARFDQALAYWQAVLPATKPGDPVRAQLEAAIREVHQLMGATQAAGS